MTSLFSALKYSLEKEILLAYRQRQEFINPLLFFAITITLFPFGIDTKPSLLQMIAPGIIWIVALLANLLSLDRLFTLDAQEGTLEQLLLTPHPLSLFILVKLLTHWLVTGVPLILMALIFSVVFNIPTHSLPILILSLILGTPTLSLIGGIGAAFTVKLQHSGMLLALIVLPLYIPILIYGTSAVSAANAGISATGQLAYLGALLLLGLSFTPLVIAAILRIGIE